jgi:hypothetical protein
MYKKHIRLYLKHLDTRTWLIFHLRIVPTGNQIGTRHLFRPPKWEKRRGKQKVFGRVFYVHPNNTELFALRLLLHHQKGCATFEDIRTIEGCNDNQPFATYVETAKALGLLHDETEWEEVIMQASVDEAFCAADIRHLFVSILMENTPNNAGEIFWRTVVVLGEDYVLQENHMRL